MDNLTPNADTGTIPMYRLHGSIKPSTRDENGYFRIHFQGKPVLTDNQRFTADLTEENVAAVIAELLKNKEVENFTLQLPYP
jgi:hypothetical protein